MSAERLARIDEAVLASIERKETPGAVVLVGRKGRVVYRKAFGDRAVAPKREPMTTDTIFDLASLTKIVATATSMMILVERGKVSLPDPVSLYIPEFGKNGKERITVEQLMTHRAGLPPDNEIADYVGVSINPLEKIYELQPSYEPGTRFVYSDVGFIVAAEIVRRVSGKPIDQFARENIFAPLRMKDTAYLPIEQGPERDGLSTSKSQISNLPTERIAPTETREGRMMRGEVHDPRSYEMSGIAGHAGLFSTADDLAIFCRMILNKGEYGRRKNTRALHNRADDQRALASDFADARHRMGCEQFVLLKSRRHLSGRHIRPYGIYGHEFVARPRKRNVRRDTDESRSPDRARRCYALAFVRRFNRRRLDHRAALRARYSIRSAAPVSYIEAPRAAISRSGPPAGLLHPVLTGIDVLERDGFKQLEGRRIGLITNHTGRNRAGRSTIDVLAAAKNVKLVALFSPEHGLRGIEDTNVNDARDEKTGLPVHSLYDKDKRRPSAEMLKDIDTLVFDIQDIGARFYTYITTCGYAMEEAARNKIKFVVLDRPNPINGYEIEGPVADSELTAQPQFSFTSYHQIPVRYGMTIGELAMLFNRERNINADLTVIKMEGWRRADFFDGTSLVVGESVAQHAKPRQRRCCIRASGLLETTNLSVGRGTDTPFEVIGAPWIDAAEAERCAQSRGACWRAIRACKIHTEIVKIRQRRMQWCEHPYHRSRVFSPRGSGRRDRLPDQSALFGHMEN